MRGFKDYNPYVILVHFLTVTGICMFVMHPVLEITALFWGIAYSVVLKGTRRTALTLLYLSGVILLAALINPLFNHKGVTILGYFPSGNPLTLEAVIYGIISGVMLSSVMLWFSCFNHIFKSDKILYVFGKAAPSVSLLMSMVLRFVPRLKKHLEDSVRTQRILFGDTQERGFVKRFKSAVKVMSSTVSWSLESSIETADGMKARGFGTGKRTLFSTFHFDTISIILLATEFAAAVVLFFLIGFMEVGAMYYPVLEFSCNAPGIAAFAVYAVFCSLPIILDLTEVIRWR